MRRSIVTTATLLLATWAGWAASFEPVDGMEFLWTNGSGTTFVGYGRVLGDVLEIEFSGAGGDLRILVVGPDHTLTHLRGAVQDGRPRVELGGCGSVDLALLLSRAGVSLLLRGIDGTTKVVAPPMAEGGATASASADGCGAGSAAEAEDARSVESPAVESPAVDSPAGGGGLIAPDVPRPAVVPPGRRGSSDDAPRKPLTPPGLRVGGDAEADEEPLGE